MHSERELWAEAERQSLRAEAHRPDLLAAVVAAAVAVVPLAVGVATGHRLLGLFCSLGGLNVALALPTGTRVFRRRWGTVALIASTVGVAAASAVSSSLWLSVVATFLWVALWCLFRCDGAAAVGVAFVTVAVFVIVGGQSAHLSDVLPRTAAYLVGGFAALAAVVAVGRPSDVATPSTTGLVDTGRLLALARSPGPPRANAVRAAVMVAAATLLYRLVHIPDGYWIPLAVIAVLQPDSGRGRTRALQRALGTLAGVAVAGLVILTTDSVVVLLAFVTLAAVALFALKARNYFWMVLLLTPLVLLMMSVVHPEGLRIVGYRVADTFAGTALALVVVEIWERGPTGDDGRPGGAPLPGS